MMIAKEKSEQWLDAHICWSHRRSGIHYDTNIEFCFIRLKVTYFLIMSSSDHAH